MATLSDKEYTVTISFTAPDQKTADSAVQALYYNSENGHTYPIPEGVDVTGAAGAEEVK